MKHLDKHTIIYKRKNETYILAYYCGAYGGDIITPQELIQCNIVRYPGDYKKHQFFGKCMKLFKAIYG